MLTRPDFLRQLTVSKMSELLTQLQPTDYLVANEAGGLSIVRDGEYIGFIEMESVTIFGRDDEDSTPQTGRASADT